MIYSIFFIKNKRQTHSKINENTFCELSLIISAVLFRLLSSQNFIYKFCFSNIFNEIKQKTAVDRSKTTIWKLNIPVTLNINVFGIIFKIPDTMLLIILNPIKIRNDIFLPFIKIHAVAISINELIY